MLTAKMECKKLPCWIDNCTEVVTETVTFFDFSALKFAVPWNSTGTISTVICINQFPPVLHWPSLTITTINAATVVVVAC